MGNISKIRSIMLDRVGDVFAICFPVFAIIALGKILAMKRFLSPSQGPFLNQLTFYIALPTLIFLEVAKQPFNELFRPDLVLSSWAGVFGIMIINLVIALIRQLKGGHASVFVFGGYWSNITYMGFPLAANALGDSPGLAFAAILNAFTMPLFVSSGYLWIAWFKREKSQSFGKTIKPVIFNPVILSAIVGLGFSLISVPYRNGAIPLPAEMGKTLQAIAATLSLLGKMGLPLALLAAGSSLNLGSWSNKPVSLIWLGLSKLVIFPLITWLTLFWFFPSAPQTVVVASVLLMATPNAVGSYVIARQTGADHEFLNSLLVLTTLGSVLTIPVWLYFLLPVS